MNKINNKYFTGSSSMIEIRRPVIPKSTAAARKLEVDDGIAEDVRKIKESMKEQQKSSSSPIPAGRKPRTPAVQKADKTTPKATKSRASKRSVKVVKEPSPEITTPEEEKSKGNEELKNELLADWMEDDDEIAPEKDEIGNFYKILG